MGDSIGLECMQDLVDKIIDRINPENISVDHLDLAGYHLVALGKPAANFAKVLNDKYEFSSVLCYIKKGHRVEASFEQWEGEHPVPSEHNLELTNQLITKIKDYDKIVFIITGGASSLLIKPKLPWKDFLEIWKAMLLGGWGIEEMNQIRILMSEVKGGGLLNHLKTDKVVNLYISDVPSHHFSYVSSSPTKP
jgi:glycerate 2-kinase